MNGSASCPTRAPLQRLLPRPLGPWSRRLRKRPLPSSPRSATHEAPGARPRWPCSTRAQAQSLPRCDSPKPSDRPCASTQPTTGHAQRQQVRGPSLHVLPGLPRPRECGSSRSGRLDDRFAPSTGRGSAGAGAAGRPGHRPAFIAKPRASLYCAAILSTGRPSVSSCGRTFSASPTTTHRNLEGSIDRRATASRPAASSFR